MPETGKRVSWVELYLDLVFVLAVGRLAHLIVAEPRMHSVWIALGLFFVLWWTWVGFAVLYNRHGADEPNQRFLFLLASIPAGVAAVAIEPVSKGDVAVFAGSLAVIRLILAFGYVVAEGGTDILRRRITRACLGSAALFAVSIAVPERSGTSSGSSRSGSSRARCWPRTARRWGAPAAIATCRRWRRPTPRRRSTPTTSPSASACSSSSCSARSSSRRGSRPSPARAPTRAAGPRSSPR
jgi:hypothetical protein